MMMVKPSGNSGLPVAVIGLGNIAHKAYLPVLTAVPDVDLHLMSRSPATVDRVADTYRVPRRFTDLDALLDTGIRAAFVHTPTEQHYPIVTRLLEAGVDVMVDKPLSYDLKESTRLVRLAREQGRSLMVGFNRRHAPAYQAALGHPRDLVIIQKDRRGDPGAVRTIVLDDFIHLIDTLRMLAPADIAFDVHGRVDAGLLHHVVVRATAPGFTGLAVMNRASGSSVETLHTAGANLRRDVIDLTEVTLHNGPATSQRPDAWEPVGHRRGFHAMCTTFLDAVRTGETLDATDALTSHQWCEQIIENLQSSHTP
ncbi:Gfo/Idh/MocA family protein [Streptomyces sp. NPDC047999]|uniref:Gfo/Idh/MocA family protein n=1 Tax=Streptomyces sp. NPDC047999 TaxID=3365497 RepID=UPI00371486D2